MRLYIDSYKFKSGKVIIKCIITFFNLNVVFSIKYFLYLLLYMYGYAEPSS